MRSQEEENEQMGMYDEDDNRLFKNTDTNGKFHSDWCSMMYPRLMLARNLLVDDGVIFISIDDHELESLEMLCDEIFSKTNFVGCLILQTATDNNPRQINTEHEYILCYAKNKSKLGPWSASSEKAQLIQEKYEELKSVFGTDYTRIQVEHPITEMRTGIDIVKEQIRIAAGEVLKIKQKEVKFNGHAIECRINAENPDKNFRPCPGKVTGLHFPGGNGIRIDSAIYAGYTIPANYDSMIAKIIAFGTSRNEAIAKMKRALEELVIEGVETNRDFLFEIITNPNFIRGDFDTQFLKNFRAF